MTRPRRATRRRSTRRARGRRRSTRRRPPRRSTRRRRPRRQGQGLSTRRVRHPELSVTWYPAAMRTPFVVGNWKLHKTVAEAQALVGELKNALGAVRDVAVGVAPPYTALYPVAKRLE